MILQDVVTPTKRQTPPRRANINVSFLLPAVTFKLKECRAFCSCSADIHSAEQNA